MQNMPLAKNIQIFLTIYGQICKSPLKRLKTVFFVPNPRQRYEIDIMEAEGKEKTQSMIEIL